MWLLPTRMSKCDDCFFPYTAKLQNSIPSQVFPKSYNLSILKMKGIYLFRNSWLSLFSFLVSFFTHFLFHFSSGLDEDFWQWLRSLTYKKYIYILFYRSSNLQIIKLNMQQFLLNPEFHIAYTSTQNRKIIK